MRVLVTGGCGFIGQAVVSRLKFLGHEPIIVDDMSTGHRLTLGTEVHRLDICDAFSLNYLFRGVKPDAVIHLAGLSSVSEGEELPGTYQVVNGAGTHVVLDAMERNGVKNLVFSSSCSVYADSPCSLSPDSTTLPMSVYGKSKLRAEGFIRERTSIRHTILRYFNVVGDGDTNNRLIPTLVRAKRDGTRFNMYGDCLRDYVHVSDVACATVAALRDGTNLTRNVGSGEGRNTSELVGWADVYLPGPPLKVTVWPRRSYEASCAVASKVGNVGYGQALKLADLFGTVQLKEAA